MPGSLGSRLRWGLLVVVASEDDLRSCNDRAASWRVQNRAVVLALKEAEIPDSKIGGRKDAKKEGKRSRYTVGCWEPGDRGQKGSGTRKFTRKLQVRLRKAGAQ